MGSAGVPNQPLRTSQAVTVTAGQAAGWVTLSFDTPVSLAAGWYWLVLHTGGTTIVARYAASSVTGALRYQSGGTDAYADGASNPFGGASTDNKQISIQAIGT